MIRCVGCDRCVEHAEIALDFDANARGRLYFSGYCTRCWPPLQTGLPLFEPEPSTVSDVTKVYDPALD